MDSTKLASGDNTITNEGNSNKGVVNEQISLNGNESLHKENIKGDQNSNKEENNNIITSEIIDDKESKLKERISQCRSIIESLKFELNEEKANFEGLNEVGFHSTESKPSTYIEINHNFTYHEIEMDSANLPSAGAYSACVDKNLICDENLIEYEKQLQIYQNTLNMAQIEKKNAIRKQMLAKAFKLKLLEVENQCNIELLRVKQNLQCLEPLQMIARNWKSGNEEYDLNKFDLIPRFPELKATNSGIDLDSCKEDMETKPTPRNTNSNIIDFTNVLP